jgi:hypothetical protein
MGFTADRISLTFALTVRVRSLGMVPASLTVVVTP